MLGLTIAPRLGLLLRRLGFPYGSGSYIFLRKSSSKEDLQTEAIELVQESNISMVFSMDVEAIIILRKSSSKEDLHTEAIELAQESNISTVCQWIWKLQRYPQISIDIHR